MAKNRLARSCWTFYVTILLRRLLALLTRNTKAALTHSAGKCAEQHCTTSLGLPPLCHTFSHEAAILTQFFAGQYITARSLRRLSRTLGYSQ